jgi:DNA sulfur modification protein DndB
MPDEKKGKKFYTGWIGRLNDLRKIAAHKNELREYKDPDVEFVSWLASELFPKLGAENE